MPADIALQRVTAEKSRHGAAGDFVFRHLTFLFALLVLLILGGVIVTLIDGAIPALRTFGVAFLSPTSGTRSPKNSAHWLRCTEPSSPRLSQWWSAFRWRS